MKILRGDVRDIAATLDAESFDGCLCDPPYGLSFMGKKWDYDVPSVETWAAVLGALKPGAHLLAFAGTRTQHRMAVRIEDAGFEIRDMIAWVYGSGFPKSLDVSKAIDKADGATRKVVGPDPYSRRRNKATPRFTGTQYANGKEWQGLQTVMRTAPATLSSAQWQGYGTALKPALEPITVARKPLVGTVADNVMQYGTGGLNIDACRVGTGQDKGVWPITQRRHNDVAWTVQPVETDTATGRWPANLIHDGSEEVVAGFPETGKGQIGGNNDPNGSLGFHGGAGGRSRPGVPDSGSAARYFYCAKASRREREAGLDAMPKKNQPSTIGDLGPVEGNPRKPATGHQPRIANHHPTVKPLALAEYLARLILPPKLDKPRRLLVPFCGSGSEIIGALRAGWDEVVGIELSPEYAEIAEARIAHWMQSYQSELVEAV